MSCYVHVFNSKKKKKKTGRKGKQGKRMATKMNANGGSIFNFGRGRVSVQGEGELAF